MAQLVFSPVTLDDMLNGSRVGAPFGRGNAVASMISGGSVYWATKVWYNIYQHGILKVYKGAMPTWDTFTDMTSRSSDLLLEMSLPPALSTYSALGVVNNAQRYKVGIMTTPTAAIASGTASWFVLHATYSGTATPTLTTLTSDKGAMTGTIGVTGSGADLEIGSTAIESGIQYTSAGITLNFPLAWSV